MNMDTVYYLAVDIGASSGRHILGSVQDGRIVLEEVYRFENGMKKSGETLIWDWEQLYTDIKAGIRACKDLGKIPASMGIDTWAVDFVLLDENDMVIGDMVGYRDSRTQGMDAKVYEHISEHELYKRTGIQKLPFNTIYQWMAVKEQHPEQLEKAKTMLFVPDFFNFLLTGQKVNEYTNATASQMVSPETKEWDYELISRMGYPEGMFMPIRKPGTSLGRLRSELVEELGLDLEVILPCTHDTGSAVLSVPANDDDFLYISSGTWSLLGIERGEADCSDESLAHNFTNEGGYDYQFRYLKNIMGLWMIQSIRHEFDDKYSFAEICEQAEQVKDFPSRVDANDDVFLAPDSMVEAVKEYCAKTGQIVPETLGELATVVYASLAECYDKTIKGIEETTGRIYSRVHVIGGGANAGYLNQLTANATKKKVFAGPTEATAIGNLVAQMLAKGEFATKTEARDAIAKSFDITMYQPNIGGKER